MELTLKQKKEILNRVRRKLRLKATDILKVHNDTGYPRKWLYDQRSSARAMPTKFNRITGLDKYFNPPKE